MAKTLFEEVRSEQNIFSAWRQVKHSALNSSNADIRGKASEFEHAHQRHLRRIIDQLRTGKLSFDPVEGVLKDKRKRLAAGKDPRPIAISTIQNRVVQRAILQVLQPRLARDLRDPNTRFETSIDKRLGLINEVNRSAYGVGGLIYPYGGVRPAIEKIMSAMDAGAKYYFQSDIRSFFTGIPQEKVIAFVRRETVDEALCELFSKALEVHLGNADELVGYTHLFRNRCKQPFDSLKFGAPVSGAGWQAVFRPICDDLIRPVYRRFFGLALMARNGKKSPPVAAGPPMHDHERRCASGIRAGRRIWPTRRGEIVVRMRVDAAAMTGRKAESTQGFCARTRTRLQAGPRQRPGCGRNI